MKHTRIWRLERPDGRGPYRDLSGEAERRIRRETKLAETQGRHPTPPEDPYAADPVLSLADVARHKGRGAHGSKFGFQSLTQARLWFTEPDLKVLAAIEPDLCLVAYDVPETDDPIIGRHQAVFWPSGTMKPLVSRPALDLYKPEAF